MNYRTSTIHLPLVKEAQGIRLSTAEDVSELCDDVRDLALETFHVLTINVKRCLIDRYMIRVGTVDHVLVPPRAVFLPAITDMAAMIVLVHNHPSADPTPSTTDVLLTDTLLLLGAALEVRILDHVIIVKKTGRRKPFLSMRKKGLCPFE